MKTGQAIKYKNVVTKQFQGEWRLKGRRIRFNFISEEFKMTPSFSLLIASMGITNNSFIIGFVTEFSLQLNTNPSSSGCGSLVPRGSQAKIPALTLK